MKNIIVIPFLTVVILLSGCLKDVLDRKPLNIISDKDVWESEAMINFYLVPLYNAIPIGFGSEPYPSCFTDEATAATLNFEVPVSDYGNIAFAKNSNVYSWIRKANYFLDRIKTATLPEAEIKQYIAECRFIRAYYYFDLARKYGGMPIVDEVQMFSGSNLDSLQVPRSTEDELYSYILNELDAAVADLPDSWDSGNANRATKMIAQALKSRAMLYAGSIAKYGTVQLNGLVGIPASKADFYFNESVKASKAVMQSNKYALYVGSYDPITKSGDPVENYTDLFLNKNNQEVIFQKAYRYPEKPHSWDYQNTPASFLSANGSSTLPLLGLVESYEYIDGTSGTLPVSGLEFNSPGDLFKDRDPRFAASILGPGSPFLGKFVEIYNGIYDTDGTLFNVWGAQFPKDLSMLQVGKDGPKAVERYTTTGFYIRKYLNQSEAATGLNTSDQNYIDIRYAEILLNFTEAAIESGTNLSEALNAINLVRNRAGIKLLASDELTIDRLRNERKVELAFEDKRFWDIRRWRIGTNIFRNTYMSGLYPYLKYNGSGYKYTFTKISGFPIDRGLSRVFSERDYYSNLSDYVGLSKVIVNNPGW
jgi:hypothetical protein